MYVDILLTDINLVGSYQGAPMQAGRGETAFSRGAERYPQGHPSDLGAEPVREKEGEPEFQPMGTEPSYEGETQAQESVGADSHFSPEPASNNHNEKQALNSNHNLKTLQIGHESASKAEFAQLLGRKHIRNISLKPQHETVHSEEPSLSQPGLILPVAQKSILHQTAEKLVALPKPAEEEGQSGVGELSGGKLGSHNVEAQPGAEVNKGGDLSLLQQPGAETAVAGKLPVVMPEGGDIPGIEAAEQSEKSSTADGVNVTDKARGQGQIPAELILQTSVSDKPAVAEAAAVMDKEPFSIDGKPVAANNEPAFISEKFIEVHENPAVGHRSETAEQRLSAIAEKLSDRPPAVGTPEGSAGLLSNGKSQVPTEGGPQIPKSLESGQIDVSSGKNEGHTPSASQDNVGSNFAEHLLADVQSSGGQQTSSTASSDAQGALSAGARAENLPGIAEQIGETIRVSLQRADQEVTVSLNPPQLGRVRIRFRDEAGQVIGLLEVDKIQTRNEIQQTIPEIVRSIQDSGVQVKRLEVVLNGNTQTDGNSGSGESSTEQGYPHKHNPAGNYDRGPAHTEINGWQLEGSDYANDVRTATEISDDSINVWI